MLPDFSSQKAKEKYFHTLRDEQKIDVFNEMIDESEHIVFLGGAGVSTESGIPDFRSKDGLYHKKDKKFNAYKPEYLLSYDCLDRRSEVFFDYFRSKLDCRSIQPNDAHRKLAEMACIRRQGVRKFGRYMAVHYGVTASAAIRNMAKTLYSKALSLYPGVLSVERWYGRM